LTGAGKVSETGSNIGRRANMFYALELAIVRLTATASQLNQHKKTKHVLFLGRVKDEQQKTSS